MSLLLQRSQTSARSPADSNFKRHRTQCRANKQQLLFSQVTSDRAFLPEQDPLVRYRSACTLTVFGSINNVIA
jgi:hypothetical protein